MKWSFTKLVPLVAAEYDVTIFCFVAGLSTPKWDRKYGSVQVMFVRNFQSAHTRIYWILDHYSKISIQGVFLKESFLFGIYCLDLLWYFTLLSGGIFARNVELIYSFTRLPSEITFGNFCIGRYILTKLWKLQRTLFNYNSGQSQLIVYITRCRNFRLLQ